MFAVGVAGAAHQGPLISKGKGAAERPTTELRGPSRGPRGAPTTVASTPPSGPNAPDEEGSRVLAKGQSFRKKKHAPNILLPALPARTGNVAFKQTVLSDDVQATRYRTRSDGGLDGDAQELVEQQARLFGVPLQVAAKAVVGAREVQFHSADAHGILSPTGPYMKRWDVVIVLCLFFTCVVSRSALRRRARRARGG